MFFLIALNPPARHHIPLDILPLQSHNLLYRSFELLGLPKPSISLCHIRIVVELKHKVENTKNKSESELVWCDDVVEEAHIICLNCLSDLRKEKYEVWITQIPRLYLLPANTYTWIKSLQNKLNSIYLRHIVKKTRPQVIMLRSSRNLTQRINCFLLRI